MEIQEFLARSKKKDDEKFWFQKVHHILNSNYGWIPLKDLLGEEFYIEVDADKIKDLIDGKLRGWQKVVRIKRDGMPMNMLWNLLSEIEEQNKKDSDEMKKLKRRGR